MMEMQTDTADASNRMQLTQKWQNQINDIHIINYIKKTPAKQKLNEN